MGSSFHSSPTADFMEMQNTYTSEKRPELLLKQVTGIQFTVLLFAIFPTSDRNYFSIDEAAISRGI